MAAADIAIWIRENRERLGMSQRGLARAVNHTGLAHMTASWVNMAEKEDIEVIGSDKLQALESIFKTTMSQPGLADLHAEGLDSQFLRDLAAIENQLTPEHRSALVETARTLARQDQEKRNQRRKALPVPAESEQSPEREQPGSGDRISARLHPGRLRV